MQHARVVEVGQVGHVLAPLELGRVDLLDLVLLEDLPLVLAALDGHLVPLRRLDRSLYEAPLLDGNPAGPFRIIRLQKTSPSYMY